MREKVQYYGYIQEFADPCGLSLLLLLKKFYQLWNQSQVLVFCFTTYMTLPMCCTTFVTSERWG